MKTIISFFLVSFLILSGRAKSDNSGRVNTQSSIARDVIDGFHELARDIFRELIEIKIISVAPL